jgi:streptogramin lyase
MRSIWICLVVLAGLVAAGAGGAAPVGAITEFPNPGSNDAQVRAGVDGSLWFTDRAGRIGQITAAGAITEFSAGLNAGSQPFSIVSGPDGKLWFTDAGTGSAIGAIDPTRHAIEEFSAGLDPGSKPAGIALGPDGNLWFTDGSTTMPAIGTNDPSTHAIREFSRGLNAGSSPGAAIAVGADGAPWFVDPGTTGAIGTIDPGTHAIAEFPTGPGSVPGRIATGPDGELWFTDKGTTPAIASIDPGTHAIAKYTSGINAGGAPGGIGTAPDGNMWFTDQGAIRAMGRAGVGAPAPSVTPPSVSGSGGVRVAKTCGRDSWSTWAGQQPSRSAFGFDGYQWLLDGSPIGGATGASYTPDPADAGHALSCRVTATYQLAAVTVTATSAAVVVEGAAEQLSELRAAVTGVGPGKSLASKFASVGADVAAGGTEEACAELDAFAHEVTAQTGKKLDAALSASIRGRAHDIEAALAC